MSLHLFYIEQPLSAPGVYEVTGQEAQHMLRVLRMRPGDAAMVFDGTGGRAQCTLQTTTKNTAVVQVDHVMHDPQPRLTLTLAVAIPKGKRWQMLVEKAVELGADAIVPILAERSVAKGEGDSSKWQQWALAAAKQSRRSWLPVVHTPVPLEQAAAVPTDVRLLAAPQGEAPAVWAGRLAASCSCMVFVGPEGGFTCAEEEAIVRAGALRARLAPGILRIETAAMAACAVIRALDLNNG